MEFFLFNDAGLLSNKVVERSSACFDEDEDAEDEVNECKEELLSSFVNISLLFFDEGGVDEIRVGLLVESTGESESVFVLGFCKDN